MSAPFELLVYPLREREDSRVLFRARVTGKVDGVECSLRGPQRFDAADAAAAAVTLWQRVASSARRFRRWCAATTVQEQSNLLVRWVREDRESCGG